jgi:hypothetical protein
MLQIDFATCQEFVTCPCPVGLLPPFSLRQFATRANIQRSNQTEETANMSAQVDAEMARYRVLQEGALT